MPSSSAVTTEESSVLLDIPRLIRLFTTEDKIFAAGMGFKLELLVAIFLPIRTVSEMFGPSF